MIELVNPEIHEKKWGWEEWIINRDYCGKLLVLKKGFRCSIHYHKKKDETFYVLEGKILLELDGDKKILKKGDIVIVEPGMKHRFTGLENSKIIEFSSHHEDSDSYREVESGSVDINELNLEDLK